MVLFSTTVDSTCIFFGNSQILLWENGEGNLAKYQYKIAKKMYASGAWKRGKQAWEKYGVRISAMGSLPVTIHCGTHYDNKVPCIINEKYEDDVEKILTELS